LHLAPDGRGVRRERPRRRHAQRRRGRRRADPRGHPTAAHQPDAWRCCGRARDATPWPRADRGGPRASRMGLDRRAADPRPQPHGAPRRDRHAVRTSRVGRRGDRRRPRGPQSEVHRKRRRRGPGIPGLPDHHCVDPRRDRLPAGGTQARRPRHAALGADEPDPPRAAVAVATGRDSDTRGARDGAAHARHPADPPEVAGAAGRDAERRQPAEGRAREPAAHQSARARAPGADARRRRGRSLRDSSVPSLDRRAGNRDPVGHDGRRGSRARRRPPGRAPRRAHRRRADGHIQDAGAGGRAGREGRSLMARAVDEEVDPGAPAPNDAPKRDAALSGRTRLALGAMQGLGLGGFYIIVLIYFSVSAPFFFSASNAVNILSNVSVIGIVTLGQAYVLIAGGFDLSVSGTVPLGGVIFTMLINRGTSIPEAWTIAVLAGCAIGLANGLIITRIGINALVTTLGTWSITVGLAYVVTNGETVAFNDLNQGPIDNVVLGMPLYVWTMILITVIAFAVLRFSVYGRMIYAIGGNREASR